jgi:hypothetical protein
MSGGTFEHLLRPAAGRAGFGRALTRTPSHRACLDAADLDARHSSPVDAVPTVALSASSQGT